MNNVTIRIATKENKTTLIEDLGCKISQLLFWLCIICCVAYSIIFFQSFEFNLISTKTIYASNLGAFNDETNSLKRLTGKAVDMKILVLTSNRRQITQISS